MGKKLRYIAVIQPVETDEEDSLPRIYRGKESSQKRLNERIREVEIDKRQYWFLDYVNGTKNAHVRCARKVLEVLAHNFPNSRIRYSLNNSGRPFIEVGTDNLADKNRQKKKKVGIKS